MCGFSSPTQALALTCPSRAQLSILNLLTKISTGPRIWWTCSSSWASSLLYVPEKQKDFLYSGATVKTNVHSNGACDYKVWAKSAISVLPRTLWCQICENQTSNANDSRSKSNTRSFRLFLYSFIYHGYLQPSDQILYLPLWDPTCCLMQQHFSTETPYREENSKWNVG